MHSPKLIAFAALTVMTLAALPTPSASAATVCSTSGTGSACKAGHGNVYTGKLVAENSGILTFKVTSEMGEVLNTLTSEESLIEGSVTNGATGVGNITKLTFNKLKSNLCSQVSRTTTASSTNPWPISVATELATENTNGSISWENVTWSYSCTFLGFSVTCKYRAAKIEGKLDGSDTAPKLTISEASLEREEGNATICGAGEDLIATYNVTTPTSLFVE